MVAMNDAERTFVERVRPLLSAFLDMCAREGIEPGAGSYVLSERGNIYHGVPFDVGRCIHGEENAIGTMVTEEGELARFTAILIVGSPESPIMPCGMCRMAIKEFGTQGVSILCANLSLSTIEKFTIDELYPHPYQETE